MHKININYVDVFNESLPTEYKILNSYVERICLIDNISKLDEEHRKAKLIIDILYYIKRVLLDVKGEEKMVYDVDVKIVEALNKDSQNVADNLKGNIDRMYSSENMLVLESMYRWARSRLDTLYSIKRNILEYEEENNMNGGAPRL